MSKINSISLGETSPQGEASNLRGKQRSVNRRFKNLAKLFSPARPRITITGEGQKIAARRRAAKGGKAPILKLFSTRSAKIK